MLLSFLAIDGYKFIPQVRYWWRNKEIKQGYVEEISRLQQEQERMKEEIEKLKNNALTHERLAREIGYIKPGETVYKFVPKGHNDSGLDQ
jgi:cell division protein FtsB